MKPLPCLLALLCLAAPLIADAGVSRPAPAEEVLLDAPGGHPVAILLPGAVRRLGEERDGFVRVTVEGWIRLAPPPTGAGTPPEVSDGAMAAQGVLPSPPTQPAALAAASLSGRIVVQFPERELRTATGARVTLLGGREALEARQGDLRAQFESDGAELDRKIAEANREKSLALSSTENFREATRRKDRAKTALAESEKKKEDLRATFAARLEALFESHRVAATFTDVAGGFVLRELPPGGYRLLAVAIEGDLAVRWYLPVEIPPSGETRIDLGMEERGPDPYFGTK